MADPQTAVAVPPPVEPMTATTTPAIPGQQSSIASVQLDYPDRFKQIAEDLPQANNQANRVRLADNIAAQEKESSGYHPNEQMQVGKMIVSLLSRDYASAYKYFNGGGKVEEEAADVNNKLYYKERNELGFTGRIKDANGKLLSAKEMADLNSRGGVFTNTDTKALQTAPWVNGKYNSELANKGLTSQLQLVTNDAYNAARVAGSSNKNIDEQLQLAEKHKGAFDYISSLPAERRQKLLGFTQRYLTNSTNLSRAAESGAAANAGQQTSATNAANASLGLGATGVEGAGAVPPPGSKLGAGAGVSASNTAGTTGGASTRAQNTVSNAVGNTLQDQQNLQTAIMQELQGILKSAEDFREFMRVQALDAQNKQDLSNIPAHALPPGYQQIPEADVLTMGSEAILANRVAQQRNNSLMAAWNAELYKAQREQAKTGKQFDAENLGRDFEKSDIYKAINNTYSQKLNRAITGQAPQHKENDMIVDKSNRILVRSPKGEWRYLND